MALTIDLDLLVELNACDDALFWWEREIGAEGTKAVTLEWLLALAADRDWYPETTSAPCDFLIWAIHEWVRERPEALALTDRLIGLIGWPTICPAVAGAFTAAGIDDDRLVERRDALAWGHQRVEFGNSALTYWARRHDPKETPFTREAAAYWAAYVITQLLTIGAVPGTRRALVALDRWLAGEASGWHEGRRPHDDLVERE